MIEVQEAISTDLVKHVGKFGKLTAYNAIGYKMTFYGYIRKVEADHIIWEHSDDPKPFKIRRVISFDPENILQKHY